MSISSLANAAAARRTDFYPLTGAPTNYSEIAGAAATVTPAPAQMPQQPPAAETANGTDTTLNVLFGYIPTEVLTLYVALIAALQNPAKVVTEAQWIAFWVFLGLTPFIFWTVYAVKVKNAGKPTPIHPLLWPWWEMIAATIAYTVWAFALPNTPFTAYDWYSSALAGVVVLFVSTFLGLIAPLFQHQIVVPQ